MKPFLYALADIQGQPILNDFCVAESHRELEECNQGDIENLTANVVPVYTGPQIEAMQDRLEAAVSALRELKSLCDTLMDEDGNVATGPLITESYVPIFNRVDEVLSKAPVPRTASIARAQSADRATAPTTTDDAGSTAASCSIPNDQTESRS